MILLTEAIDRYAIVAGDHGIRVSRRRRSQTGVEALAELENRIAPLKLPAELHAFWANWDPRSFGSLFFDGVYEIHEAVEVYERDIAAGFPRTVMPVVQIEKAGIWVELASPDHPGGRIYHTFYDDGSLQLWCVDISSLVHLVAETVDRDGVKDPNSSRPWIDVAVFDEVRLEQTAELLAMPDEWQIPVAQRERWPEHWAKMQREDDQKAVDLRQSASHTVAEFEEARTSGRLRATLHGQITGIVSGGPIDGLIVNFADDSGSIPVLVSAEVEQELTRLGIGARVEVEVLGEPTPARKNEIKTWMLRRNLEELPIGHLRLLSQMRRLDVSVAALSLRRLYD